MLQAGVTSYGRHELPKSPYDAANVLQDYSTHPRSELSAQLFPHSSPRSDMQYVLSDLPHIELRLNICRPTSIGPTVSSSYELSTGSMSPRIAAALMRLNPNSKSRAWRDFIDNNPEAMADQLDCKYYFEEATRALNAKDTAKSEACIRIGVVLLLVGGKPSKDYKRLFDVLAGDVLDPQLATTFQNQCTVKYADAKAKARWAPAQRPEQSSSKLSHRPEQSSSKPNSRSDLPNQMANLNMGGGTRHHQPGSRHTGDVESTPATQAVRHNHTSMTSGGRPTQPNPAISQTRPPPSDRHRVDTNIRGRGGANRPSTRYATRPSPEIRSTSDDLGRDPSIKGPSENAADEEKLDDRYVRRDAKKASQFFKKGRVFAILEHSEDTSQDPSDTDARWKYRVMDVTVFTHVRRFAVVREGHGFCWAVPINTYNGRGLKRPGMRQDHVDAHAIIYSTQRPPEPLPNEPRMPKIPIAVDLGQNADILSKASRVNFDAVTTIQHNVRAMNIGKLRESSERYFEAYWREHLLR